MRKKAHKHIQSAENILNEKLYYFQALSFESDRLKLDGVSFKVTFLLASS